MAFEFSDEQWQMVRERIRKLGSGALDWVRSEIERDLNRIFVHKDLDSKMESALRHVSTAGVEFARALEELADACERQADKEDCLRDIIMHHDVALSRGFAREVRQFVDGANWTLDDGYSASSEHGTARGRPADTSLPAFARAMLRLAECERWLVEDDRGRTKSEFMDLLMAVASCAKSAGFEHSRDVRRALTRAVSQVRQELKDEACQAALLRSEFDKLADSPIKE